VDDASGEAPLAGLEDSAFGVGESGEIQVGELVEIALGLAEARLELARGGPQRRDGALTRLGNAAVGIAHERLARRRVRCHPPGREEGRGLARAKRVAHDGLGETRLLAAGNARQAVGGGGRKAAVVEVRGQLGGEVTTEREPAIHPGATPTRGLGDLCGGEVIVVRERTDHARLVHGAHGASWGVGLKHPDLAHETGGVLHDHGDVGVALAAPAGQTLEAIEDLVGAVTGRSHPQGQRGQGHRGIGARSPEGSERGRQPIDGDVTDEAHGRSSDRGRIW